MGYCYIKGSIPVLATIFSIIYYLTNIQKHKYDMTLAANFQIQNYQVQDFENYDLSPMYTGLPIVHYKNKSLQSNNWREGCY